MRVEALLWDFGDTLVDETWMHRAPPDCARWPEAWADVMAQYADDWNTGRVDERAVFGALCAHTCLDFDAVERHAADCCRSIERHPVAWQVMTGRRRPQALVTVNPDLFVHRVLTPHGLAEHFDTVVVSCLEGTDDKVQLCCVACERLGVTDRGRALLIDNRRDLVDAWQRAGGAAYWYRSDAQFRDDVDGLLA